MLEDQGTRQHLTLKSLQRGDYSSTLSFTGRWLKMVIRYQDILAIVSTLGDEENLQVIASL